MNARHTPTYILTRAAQCEESSVLCGFHKKPEILLKNATFERIKISDNMYCLLQKTLTFKFDSTFLQKQTLACIRFESGQQSAKKRKMQDTGVHAFQAEEAQFTRKKTA